MRQDFLKMYLAALVAEGHASSTSLPDFVTRAGAMFLKDLPMVAGDVLGMLAENAGGAFKDRAGALFMGEMAEFMRDVGKRGWRAKWKDVQAQYYRGVENKHGSRKVK